MNRALGRDGICARARGTRGGDEAWTLACRMLKPEGSGPPMLHCTALFPTLLAPGLLHSVLPEWERLRQCLWVTALGTGRPSVWDNGDKVAARV